MLGHSLQTFRNRREQFLAWVDTKAGKSNIAYNRGIAQGAARGTLKGREDDVVAKPQVLEDQDPQDPSTARQRGQSEDANTESLSTGTPVEEFVANYERLGGKLITKNIADDVNEPHTLVSTDSDEEVAIDTLYSDDDAAPGLPEADAQVQDDAKSKHESPSTSPGNATNADMIGPQGEEESSTGLSKANASHSNPDVKIKAPPNQPPSVDPAMSSFTDAP